MGSNMLAPRWHDGLPLAELTAVGAFPHSRIYPVAAALAEGFPRSVFRPGCGRPGVADGAVFTRPEGKVFLSAMRADAGAGRFNYEMAAWTEAGTAFLAGTCVGFIYIVAFTANYTWHVKVYINVKS
jgi:hypothetical protein